MYSGSYVDGLDRAKYTFPVKTPAIIDEFLCDNSAAVMDKLIGKFRQPDIPDEDVALLALRLAESGERIASTGNRPIADVPSTGGPSSLSTLLSPLVLVIGGAIVPKVGVPGRPAGGIDTLACIPGFEAHLSRSDLLRCLTASSYAHFLAGESFAPLDAHLFAYRRRVGAIDVPSLAIASLLSKKIAVGVNHVTLDVRVAPHTNFGSTWDEARDNAHRFMRIAQELGIAATCFLTDATMPYQPFLGRGESLIALAHIFSAEATGDLGDHVTLCSEMANLCLGTNVVPHPGQLKDVFLKHLEQQGTSWANFSSKVRQIESQPTVTLTAESDGYFTVDLNGIRKSLVNQQEAAKSTREQFPDPCGVTLLLPCGSVVNKGDVLARVRSSVNHDQILAELRLCMLQSIYPPARHRPEKLVPTDV